MKSLTKLATLALLALTAALGYFCPTNSRKRPASGACARQEGDDVISGEYKNVRVMAGVAFGHLFDVCIMLSQ